jgi:DNA (cytosine-5)-methyltransferase 1
MVAKLYDHFIPRLSELDKQMVAAVPMGGNWKDIPVSVPSARLEQIRVSYAAGEGSRSTYYGRLKPDRPAYTISTYFNRPGNGCFIHYDGGRLISPREAARLQSFPDTFRFVGSQRQVNQQIGNAVPPLLAFQIAKIFGTPGAFVDLFSGAGGLSLGFKWAGWTPIVGNDLDERFTQTYAKNIHEKVIAGDITQTSVAAAIVAAAQHSARGVPFGFLGGPPCQGFSTAGKKRSMDDQRNHLFKAYVNLLRTLQPDFFVFENVMGLKNMDGGHVYREILADLANAGYKTETWQLKAEEYAVPQRRHRLFIVGTSSGFRMTGPPTKLTKLSEASLFSSPREVSVQDALSDLPHLLHAEDGEAYGSEPQNPYQALMRGRISAQEYVDGYL